MLCWQRVKEQKHGRLEHGQNKHQPRAAAADYPATQNKYRVDPSRSTRCLVLRKWGRQPPASYRPPAPDTRTETLVFESRLAPKTADSRIAVGLLVYLLLVLSRAMICSNLRCTAMTGTCGGTAASAWASLSWASRLEYLFLVADFFSRKINQN